MLFTKAISFKRNFLFRSFTLQFPKYHKKLIFISLQNWYFLSGTDFVDLEILLVFKITKS